ncbi:MAG: DUF4115 domain-containing protein [Marinobacterium sp.]|nr:DUF4115 domain-containing protein [Marinobacterium sp.]
MSTESIAEPSEVQRFPGERLQAARLAKGATVEEISGKLHLPGSYIHALENGELDKLPSIVFARGYIRSYAGLIDIDAEEFIGYLDQLYGQPQKTRGVRSVNKVRQQVRVGHPVVRTFSWLIGIVVVVAAPLWWWNTQNATIDPQALMNEVNSVISVETGDGQTLVVSPENQPVAGADAIVVDSNPEANTAISEASVPEKPATQALSEISAAAAPTRNATNVQGQQPVAVTVDAEAAAAEEERQQVRAAALSRLTIDFSGECWVTIRDRDGKSLFNNVRRNGQQVDVTGEAPFSVLLGAANGVTSFRFNDEDVDISPFSKNNVARLTLPLE